MDEEKKIKIINELTRQGFNEISVKRFIDANKKNYVPEEDIYKELSDYLLNDLEQENILLKKIVFKAFNSAIIIAEGTHVTPNII